MVQCFGGTNTPSSMLYSGTVLVLKLACLFVKPPTKSDQNACLIMFSCAIKIVTTFIAVK